jgi:hypothetical protein
MAAILQTDPVQEPDFWREYLTDVVFSATPHTMRHTAPRDLASDGEDAIVVYSGFDKKPPRELLAALDDMPGCSLVHTCDERLQHDARHYRDARAVLRSYYDPRLLMDNVFAIPPGFKTGFLNHGPVDLEAKDLVWCFAGQVKSNRKKMLAEFARLTPCHAHLTGQWNDPKGLDVEDMRRLFARSIFVPCPVGYQNPDSFRVLECLEFGCIPVVLSFLGEDYFRFVYGDHPFVIASTWAKATAEIRGLLADPASLRARQRALVDWYARYKRDLALDVRDILSGARHDALRSRQFHHQKAGMKPRTVRRYNLYFGHGLIRRLFRNYAHAFS